MFLDFKKWVKSTQNVSYNGRGTVFLKLLDYHNVCHSFSPNKDQANTVLKMNGLWECD